MQKKNIYFLCAMTIVIFLAMALVNGLLQKRLHAGDDTQADDIAYQYHIAMICSNPDNSFFQSVYDAAQEEGKEKGCYVENFGKNLNQEYSVEELMTMAVAARVDGILVEAGGGDRMKEVIDDAAAKGIPVITLLGDAPKSSRISFVGGNNYAIGEIYGEQVLSEAEKFEGKEKISVKVLGNSGNENSAQNLIISGIRDTVKDVSSVELSEAFVQDNGKFESEETVRDLILKGEQPDILVCLSETDTISAYQCVVDYNMVGKISIIGYYSSAEILEQIEKGIISSTVSINAEEMGRRAMDGMYEYFTEEYVNGYLSVGAELITNANVQEYAKEEGL